ncbi:MAG: META domain-containing protein [Flavobacteriaceae bacterium]|jgi:heat shock protein HslJ|nr:META domain-containing protein [Flavobacteriaceae bacterium]
MKKIITLSIALIFMSCNTQKTSVETTQNSVETTIMENSENSGASLVQPKDPLLGKWQLEYLSPTSGKDIHHYKIQKPYLNFVDDHKVAGNNGCNNIAGHYDADERLIKFQTQKFASTRMFCEGVDEEAFLNALGSVNLYAIMEDGQKLLMFTDDIVILSFQKLIEPAATQ